MEYEEFETAAERGLMGLDRTYWVTQYIHMDIHNKPTRHLPPTEVKAFVNPTPYLDYNHRPKTKYYFHPVNDKGAVLPRKIKATVDYSNDQRLQVFTNKHDAQIAYIEYAHKALAQASEAREEYDIRLTAIEDKIHKNIDDNKPQ